MLDEMQKSALKRRSRGGGVGCTSPLLTPPPIADIYKYRLMISEILSKLPTPASFAPPPKTECPAGLREGVW